MSIVNTKISLFPVRRDKQIPTTITTIGGSVGAVTGGGSSSGITCLCGLTGDVTITTPQLNNVLVYNSSKWVNTNNVNLDCIAAGTCVISPIISGITCVSSPIFCGTSCVMGAYVCGTSCVRTPILCATTCSRSAVHCSTTAARAPYFCASTGIISPVIQLTTGAANGFVLTSDEFGNGSWTPLLVGNAYSGSSSICINSNIVSAIFGTTSTTVACGSHLHTGTYLPIAGCAADSCKLNGQTPSDITSNLTTGQVLYYDGTTIRSCAISSGNVNKVGTPADNQIGTWTGDGTIEGFSGFTYNGTVLVVAGNVCMGRLLFISAPTGNPEFDFREGTTTRAKTYYDVTNNRLTFQNNENNNQDALYFADHVTTTGNITIGGCLIAPAIKITTGAAAGCVLTSSADGTAAWCTPTGGASCLDALNDVVIASPACNQILQYSGSIWCNCNTTNIASNMSTGQVLCYNGTTITGVTTVSCASNSTCLGGICSSCYAPKTSTISTKTANYTLAATDNGSIIVFNSASALCLTVPTAFAGTCGYNVTVVRRGAGAVCILAGTSTTKLSDGSKSCIGAQYGAATIIAMESCNFILAGNLV